LRGLGEAVSGTSLRTAPTQGAESRDQLIARRRAAQHAWRAAREGMERAALHLNEASDPPFFAPNVARQRLELAQRGERRARLSYHRVAVETGVLLSRLADGVGRA
jgi:hypothetical protein